MNGSWTTGSGRGADLVTVLGLTGSLDSDAVLELVRQRHALK